MNEYFERSTFDGLSNYIVIGFPSWADSSNAWMGATLLRGAKATIKLSIYSIGKVKLTKERFVHAAAYAGFLPAENFNRFCARFVSLL